MIFVETPLRGAFVIELERHIDERGYFARTFCRREFADHGLNPELVQSSISFNTRMHTLRGLHYQTAPHEEAKVVRCMAGAIHDVIVDLRQDSPTYARWYAVVLTATDANAVYVPPAFAHGFLSLTDDATVLYQMSEEYHAESARGLRWDDPALAIDWPAAPAVISQRDCGYNFLEARHG